MTRLLRLRLAHDRRGYTLVEMLIVLVILGVVMEGLTTLFVSASKAEVDMNVRFQAEQTARLALDKMRRDIHCASLATPTGPTSSVTITLPLYNGAAVCKTGSGSITWCTRNLGTNRYGLYRVNGASCTGGVKWADNLTVANAFNYTAQATTSLGTMRVDLAVNVNPSKSVESYELVDDIVLRNTTRS